MKFQVGDRVKALHGCFDQFTAGKIYVVTGYTKVGNVEMIDDRGRRNGWPERMFELVSFQVGDVVNVEYRGTVTGVNSNAVWVDGDRAVRIIEMENVKFVERPIVLPTGINALIETSSGVYRRSSATEWIFVTGRYYTNGELLSFVQLYPDTYRVIFEGENA